MKLEELIEKYEDYVFSLDYVKGDIATYTTTLNNGKVLIMKGIIHSNSIIEPHETLAYLNNELTITEIK